MFFFKKYFILWVSNRTDIFIIERNDFWTHFSYYFFLLYFFKKYFLKKIFSFMGLCEQHKRHCLFQNFNDSISWQSGFHTGFSYLKTQTSLRLSSIDKLVLSVNTTSVLSPWVANWSNFDHVRSTVEANLYTTSMRRCLFNKTVFLKKIFLLWLKKKCYGGIFSSWG